MNDDRYHITNIHPSLKYAPRSVIDDLDGLNVLRTKRIFLKNNNVLSVLDALCLASLHKRGKEGKEYLKWLVEFSCHAFLISQLSIFCGGCQLISTSEMAFSTNSVSKLFPCSLHWTATTSKHLYTTTICSVWEKAIYGHEAFNHECALYSSL